MFSRTRSTERRHGRRTVLAAAGGLLALSLAACTNGGTDETEDGDGASGEGATLIAYTGQAGDYQINFNPFSPSQVQGPGTIYEPLFFINKVGDPEPQPLLGTEFAWNEEGTQLEVTLREDVTWTDGEPFTADDVVFTFDLLDEYPAINNTGWDGTVEAVDDHRVTFTWDEPAFVIGPDVLSQSVIVPEHVWADLDPTQEVMEEPVGTGAFMLGEFKPQAFTLVANPDYWGGEPAVKAIRFLALSGNTAGADAVQAGTIDWQTGPVPNIQDVEGTYPGYGSLTAAQNQMALVTCSNPELGCTGPQTDPAVRHALFYAMDRDQLNALAFQETAAEISPTYVLPDTQSEWISGGVEPAVAPSAADPDRAAEILEEAGWTKGSDGIYAKDGERLSLTVEVVTGWTDYITAIQTITEQAKAAGIEVTGAQSSWNEWTDKRVQGNFQLAIDSLWQGPAPDPYYVYNYFFASDATAPVGESAGNNVARFSQPEVDAAIDALEQINPEDAGARQEQFDIIQEHVVEQMPYVPILVGGTTSVWNTEKFTGWPTEGDMYAFPAVWSRLDAAEIFKALEPSAG